MVSKEDWATASQQGALWEVEAILKMLADGLGKQALIDQLTKRRDKLMKDLNWHQVGDENE